MRSRVRRRSALAAAAAGLLVGAPAAGAAPTPTGIDALGDSITRAFDACALGDCPVGSWATGTREDVQSHAVRLAAMRASVAGRTYNDAKSGAQMDDLDRQAALAVGRDVDYVTVLLGANDACTGSVGSMTPVATYRSELDSGLQILRDGLPGARILVLSVPDVQHLHALFRDDATARERWDTFNTCQSMLANPTSDAPADLARRAAVAQRVRDYNTQLEEACATLNDVLFPDRCRFDGGALHGTKFTPAQVSALDYFHPSIAGQAALAAEAWRTGVPFADTAAPDTTAVAADAGVRFWADEPATYECRVDGGLWAACASPLGALPPGERVVEVRALDRAGNGDPTPAVVRVSVPAPPPAPAPAAMVPQQAGAAPPPVVAARRALIAVGGRRAGTKLTTLQIGPGDVALRSVRVRLGAGVTVRRRAPGTAITLPARRRVRLELGASAREVVADRLPGGTVGLRLEVGATVSRRCAAPGWVAEVRDRAGVRSLVRAARRC